MYLINPNCPSVLPNVDALLILNVVLLVVDQQINRSTEVKLIELREAQKSGSQESFGVDR